MLSVLIADDDKTARDITASALRQFSDVTVAGAVASGEEALVFLRRTQVDLVLLDIEMPNIDGFEAADRIHREFPRIMYVFLTGHVEYALSGYDYQPLSFLVKPISISRLEHVLQMAQQKKENDSSIGQKVRQIGIHVNGQMEIIRTDDVAYMENCGRKVHIVCRDHREMDTTETLKKLALIFEEYGFFRCHQSVIVNLDLVEAIRPDMFKRTFQIQLSGFRDTLPLSRDKRNELQELLKERGMQIL
jgi:DNA-binding LytR/AlgR family response regulator